MRNFFKIIIIVFCFTGCGKRMVLSPEKYLQYINSEKSNLIVENILNNVSYTAKLQTPEFIAISNSGDKIKNQSDFINEIKYYKNKLNFIFLISDQKNQGNKVKEVLFNKEEYSSFLAYANTDLKNDFKLLNGNDTLFCAMVHMEAANSVAPTIRLTIGFSAIDTNRIKEYTLVFNDNLFRNGPLKFQYSEEAFNNLPEIKF